MNKSQTRRPFYLLFSLIVVLLGACATPPPSLTPCPACPAALPCPAPTPAVAVQAPPAKPLQAARWGDLPGWGNDDLVQAWPAFLTSCRALASRPQWPLWRAACEEAKRLDRPDNDRLREFFTMHFQPYLLTNADATTSGLLTGYYEPLLHGARTRSTRYAYPLLGVPRDLLTVDLSEVVPELKNLRLRGRLQGNKVIPYYARADIVRHENDYADRVLLWVDDAVELFFLQIQGSGRVMLPDGSLVRVGYADQNGHPYQSIGRVLIEQGELKPEQASMQGIQAWVRAHPEKLDALLNANPSYVFFREMPTRADAAAGPQGALGVPLTPERSIAVDARTVPLGAPVFLVSTRPDSGFALQRLMLAQDTGGAIRGVVRADFFWGFGAEAGSLAGRMKQSVQMWVLLPPGVAPR